MKMRRILTALLAVVMLLSVVPFGAMAAGGDTTTEENGKLFLDKTATLTDDGSYTINMEAYATGKTTSQTIEKNTPLDIVLVLDQSGSMKDELGSGKQSKQESLQVAAKNFVKKVYENGLPDPAKNKKGVNHRIGIVTFARDGEESEDYAPYLNTGIYDENGKFIGYKDTSTSKPTYQKFDGTLDINGTYFVLVKGKYVQMTYNKGADKYVPVTNPANDSTNLYGKVNGKYENATYGEYTANVEATNPVKGDGKTYYDAKGNQLTWVEEKTTKQEYVRAASIQVGKEYWINYDNNPNATAGWHKVTENIVGSWSDDTLKMYLASGNRFEGKNFLGGGNGQFFDAYELKTTETPTGNWFLSADGKTPVTPVYEKTTKTGWHVGNTPVTELYELQKGAGKWQYKDGRNTVDYDGRQVYTQTISSVFGPALVPVADNDNGKVTQHTSFETAIDSMKANGATRIALGVELGNKIFEANPLTEADKTEGRQRVMIVFTDGEPGKKGYEEGEANKALAETEKTKGTYGAKVYTIGLYSKEQSKQKAFMQNMSSNTKTDTKYYHKVTNTAGLDSVFQSIQQDISGSTTQVDLTTDSILRDIMSAEGFELTADSAIKVSIVSGSVKPGVEQPTEKDIIWGASQNVLTLKHNPNATDGVTKESKPNVKVVDSDGKNAMEIVASTHTKNPEGKADLHTVDVTGFDYKDQYIAKAHKGSKLVVEITGVKALPKVTTDKNINTNHEQSGIWAPVTAGGEREFKAPFPKRPTTHMPSKSYVVDYAKPLDLAIADFKLTSAQNIDVDGYDPFAPAVTAVKHTYGDAKIAGKHLTYTPKTMKWDGYDTFYVFGTTNDATVTAASANANGNVWSKVNVIPANNVYYEDSFMTTEETTGTVGITYTGKWEEIGTDNNASTAPEDSSNSDDNHGWIPVLDNKGGDTDGSSHHGTFVEGNTATATFTFTGTGVDIYSRTSGSTGTVIAMLKGADGKVILGKSVDTLSASDEYFQVPTLTFHEGRDGKALPHGTYSVELRVANNGENRLDYYLDGIRVYNPLQKNDSIVDDAYGPDELNATFMEVRDMLLDAKSFVGDSTKANGPVFIDQIKEGQGTDVGTGTTTTVVGTYKDYGPKNEVYLAINQSITFKVDTTQGNQFQVGLKSPTGKPVTVEYSKAGQKTPASISHTADMFYDVTAGTDGFITITNKSNALLSVTKLKITNAAAAVNTAAVFAETDVPTVLAAAQTFNAAPVTPTEPDVDIENPEEKPEKPQKPGIFDILDKIFGGIFDWIRP